LLYIEAPIFADATITSEHNAQSAKSAAPGTPYTYSIEAHFSSAQGTGSRLDGLRTCTYTLKPLSQAHDP